MMMVMTLMIMMMKMMKIRMTIASFCLGSRGAGCLGGKITPSICGSNPPS